MKKCPFCAEMIQDEAVKCRFCGEFLEGGPARPAVLLAGRFGFGYEYKSKATLFGWPLLHVAQGIDPQTGRYRVARGVIAVGNVAVGGLAVGGAAVGVVAVGGAAVGVVAVGGVGFGLAALGGVAVGRLALGGAAFGAWLAVGGLAVSLMYAIGGLAVGPHVLGGTGADPELLEKMRRFFGGRG